ncbi:hypothetical protein GETHLI_05660 [Geothrix limicola]|uniref:Lipoprotein n=1 Tax=Geothrix limicola TaxID=2927978 RepID=A0ABQ5QBX9_9BACT|nr:hypothetical protein [Geothrix limicola]GLH72064.1 hypothetical protein GETHLI_05660 [Geothrix limicola]
MSVRTYPATFLTLGLMPSLVLGLMLGIVACSSTSSPEVTVQNTDPASLKVSPAGVATIVFTDLETIRPDNLSAGVSGSGCITVTPVNLTTFRYTFNGCRSANGGTLSGTVTVTAAGTTTLVDTAVYDLTVADSAGTWHYTGTKITTINTAAKTGSVAVPAGQPFSVTFQHATDASKNKSWSYTPNLQADWSNANAMKFWGTYSFQQTQPAGDTLTATIAQATPLIWTSGCTYPTSGVLNLSLPPASAEIRFNTSITDPNIQTGCGVITINGYRLTLGQ